jgi:hypothetical protein
VIPPARTFAFPTTFTVAVLVTAGLPALSAFAAQHPDVEPRGEVRVSGQVLDVVRRTPVAGASVSTVDRAGNPTPGRETLTDDGGNFRLDLLPGANALAVAAEGYLPETIRLELAPAAPTVSVLVLLVDRGRFREQVEVVAPSDAAGADGPAELPVRPLDVMAVAGSADNVFRTLQTLPGVAATEEFGSRLAVRGGGPDENLTVMDGVEIHNPYRLFGLTSAFNPETVKSFELFTAVFPARYGDRLSSLLTVENRAGDPSRAFQGSSALSVTDANVVAEGGFAETKASWLVTGRRTYYDLVANRIVDTDLPAFADLQGKLNFEPRAGRRLTLLGVLSRESANAFVEGDRLGDEGGLVNASRNDLLAVTFESGLGGRGSSRTVASYYQNTEDLDFNAQFQAESRRSNSPDDDIAYGRAELAFAREVRVRDLAVRQELRYQAGPRHLVEVGAEVHALQTRTAFRITGDRNPFAANGSSQQGGAGLPDALDSVLDSTRTGAWVEDRFEAGSGLLLEPGLRYDWSGVNGRSTVSPRLAATLRLGTATRLRAGFGLFTQSPGYEKLVQSDYFLDLSSTGRVDLDHARATHALLGIERDLGAGVTVRLEGYYKSFRDLIVGRLETEEERQARIARYDFPAELESSIPVAPQITTFPVNGASGRAWGVDVYASRRAGPGDRLGGWASYTYGRSDRDAYSRDYPFEYDRRHAFSAVGSFRLSGKAEVSATLRVASGFPYTPVVGLKASTVEVEQTGKLVPRYDATGLVVWEVDVGDTTNLNTGRLPTFARLDLRASFRPRGPSGRWLFYLDVINVTNRQNAGAIDVHLEHDPASEYPRIVRERIAAIPFLPSFGVRFRF